MFEPLALAVFWICLAGIVYTWLLFPLALFAGRRFRRPEAAPAPAGGAWPLVTVIVSAYNEEKSILRKLDDLAGQTYPPDRLEIIVASDGSTDRTAELVKSRPAANLRLLAFEQNRGKATVHNEAVRHAAGEILVFTDAETSLAPDFLARAVAWFARPEYGCGSGEYSFRASGETGKFENVYWRLERALRAWEQELGILPFASGGCFLVRRELYAPVSRFGDIDTYLPLLAVSRGYKVFYDRSAKAYDVTAEGAGAHFRKRVRTALIGMNDVISFTGRFLAAGKWSAAWLLISQKIMRWLTGYLLLALFAASCGLLVYGGWFYRLVFAAQAAAYAAAVCGWLSERRGYNNFWLRKSVSAYSLIVWNAASALAVAKYLRGERVRSWSK